MSHTESCHVVHVNDLCHTYEWVMSSLAHTRCLKSIKMREGNQWVMSYHTCKYVMSRKWMSHVVACTQDVTKGVRMRKETESCHVTHMNESCHTYEWVISYEWVTSHIWMSHATHKRMSHVTHMNESCHTYEWVMSHIWMSHATHKRMGHVTHMNESCPCSHTQGVKKVQWRRKAAADVTR